jgi:hypothetical protein
MHREIWFQVAPESAKALGGFHHYIMHGTG